MAINPETKYTGKIDPSSSAYPYGKARNITLPGDGTGTPWEAAIVNDLFGLQQALLTAAGITPSGDPDEVGASQYLDALRLIGSFTYNDSLTYTAGKIAIKNGIIYKSLQNNNLGKDPELEFTYWESVFKVNRNFTHLPSLGYNFQFGATSEHFLSKNAVVINGDSVTQGANAGYYMDNGYAYKVRRALMEAYQSTSYGYLSVDDKDGYITTPDGAYRWYEPSTNGTLRQNDQAPNAIGGTEVELAALDFVKFEFNRQDKYSAEFIPNQRKFRIVFNDSSGSVRVTADGIGYSIDTVISTSGTGISAVQSLPTSWDGTITITQESGTPIINGIVLMSSEDDYCIHMIYNGGRGLAEISDATISKIVTGADLYIHALGINDGWGTTSESTYRAKLATLQAAIEASRNTRTLLMDFMWVRTRDHFTRVALREMAQALSSESSFIDVPAIIANGEDEYTAAELAAADINFLSSDEVHPFINGHNIIATLILSELGIDHNVQFQPEAKDYRATLLQQAQTPSYSFGDIDLSKLIIGWTSDGSNSLTFTEGAGTLVTGYIYLGFIETKIPVTEQNRYKVEIDIENVDSTGVHSFGTRSLDRLGNEIWEQDSAGGLSGNNPLSGVSVGIGTREVLSFVVGGRNAPAGTDTHKFEPNAAFWNLGLVINNGDTTGNVIIHNITITPVPNDNHEYEFTAFQGTFTAPNGLTVRKDNNGMVTFDGYVDGNGSSSGASVVILPTEFRPAVQLDIPIIDGNNDLGRIRIETGGYVRIYSTVAGAGWDVLELNSVSFTV